MKTLLFASVALGLAATPALAEQGKSHGNHGAKATHSSSKAMKSQRSGKSTLSARRDANRNGILDSRERGYRDRDRDGLDDRFESRNGRRYGANDCPPGLAKKNNGCLPPGQAKRRFAEGQRVPVGYNYYTDYANIPERYRTQYDLDPTDRYIYRDNRIYVVDPRTSIVERVIGSLIGL